MRKNYLFALVWSNTMTGWALNEATKKWPYLIRLWPSRSFGGQKVEVFEITSEYAIITIQPNGEQMPSCYQQVPQTLPLQGCPITNPLDIDSIISWVRDAFNFSHSDSVYIVPRIEAPNNIDEYQKLSKEFQLLLENQILHESTRLYNVLMNYVQQANAAPSYNTSKLFENIYVIESESGIKQGTAFHLKGYGIITCDHCIRDEKNEILSDLVIFKGYEHNKKYPVNLEKIKTNDEIDAALLNVTDLKLNEGIEIGNSDKIKQLDSIAIAGFPNYNLGDKGNFTIGSATGFRMHCGLRHILIDKPLIAGTSGGPAFDKDSKAIGIAVTGADKMSKANETEKHGLIPIEVIRFLK